MPLHFFKREGAMVELYEEFLQYRRKMLRREKKKAFKFAQKYKLKVPSTK